jgi:hypothetical protein
MTSPLDNSNPHGIRVVADRGPVRDDVKAAFAKGSRGAAAGIASLTKSQGRAATKSTK